MDKELVKKLDSNLLLMVKLGMTDKTSTLSIDLTSKELEIIIDSLLFKDKVIGMIDEENWDNRLDGLLLKLK